MCFKRGIIIFIAFIIILKGSADLALLFLGESTKAVILSTTRVNKKYSNTYVYDVQYKFLHDGKQITGSSRYSKKMMGGPTGTIEVKYFDFYPNYNNPSKGLAVYALFWIAIGVVLLIFVRKSHKKKALNSKKIYKN